MHLWNCFHVNAREHLWRYVNICSANGLVRSDDRDLCHVIISPHMATWWPMLLNYYNDVIISAVASQITSVSIVCSTVGSGAEENIKAPRHCPFFAGNSPVTGEFPAQKASNAESVSIWWHHHMKLFSRNALLEVIWRGGSPCIV